MFESKISYCPMPQITVSQEQLKEMIELGAFGDKTAPIIVTKEVLETGMVTVTYGDSISPITVRSELKTGESTIQFNLDRLQTIEGLLSSKKK